jgi:hypothetical protein
VHKRRVPLEDQVPEYGLEALVGTIEDRKELLKALKVAGKRCSTFKRRV